MPLLQTTAATVSIEVSSETLAGDAAGNYTVVRTFTATDDCWQQHVCHADHHGSKTRLLLSSPFLLTTRRSVLTI